MRCHTQHQRFYCGVDRHARTMSICILDHHGQVVLAKTLPADGHAFRDASAPFRDDLVVACECLFCWYGLADLCHEHDLAFVRGHALYLKAIHGGKTTNDKLDADKRARLLRGGNFPIAYVYPKGMRATRDLLRRRTYLVRQRAETITHLPNTNSPYHLPPFGKKLAYAAHRAARNVAERCTDPSVRQTVATDRALLDHDDERIGDRELYLTRTAPVAAPQAYARLLSLPGVGKVLALVLLDESHDIRRFASCGQFLSYARLVRCPHEAAGKVKGTGGKKIGNAHRRWANA